MEIPYLVAPPQEAETGLPDTEPPSQKPTLRLQTQIKTPSGTSTSKNSTSKNSINLGQADDGTILSRGGQAPEP